MKLGWMDRATGSVAPRWTVKRVRARMALEFIARHYDAASVGRRTMGWRRSSGDANAVVGPALARLRDAARDLVRNNPYAESALVTIADHTVGAGIIGKPAKPDAVASSVWNEWADSTTCDADGLYDFAGLQWLVMREVAEAGEVLVRRRLRFRADGLPLNTQIQVLEADYIDTSKDESARDGGRIIQGVQVDKIGRRIGYWLFKTHPGDPQLGASYSEFVPAESLLHVFKGTRAGQMRAPTWFAPILLRARDFDDMEDAVLMTQKVAACLSVILSDPDGDATPVGEVKAGRTPESPEIDLLSPGGVLNVPPGFRVDVVQPPSTTNYDAYARSQLRAIATGLGVTYEDLTGDYTGLPFSAARMSRLRHWARVNDWRWRTMIPRFCTPVWTWVMQSAIVLGRVSAVPAARWTPEPPPMIDPVNEGLAYQRLIRTGLRSLSETLREQGYDPEEVLREIANDNALLDKLGLVLDSDGRKMTQAGQLQGEARLDALEEAEDSVDATDLARLAELLATLPDTRAVQMFEEVIGPLGPR